MFFVHILHNVKPRHVLCCFRLFPFPTKKKDLRGRQRWIEAVNRADKKKKWKYMDPSKDQRVCSIHFVDGRPTAAHSDPELKLGYEAAETGRRKAPRAYKVWESRQMDQNVGATDEQDVFDSFETSVPETEDQKHIEVLTLMIVLLWALVCQLKHLIGKLRKSNADLRQENSKLFVKLKRQEADSKKTMAQKLLNNNDNCQFYTGIGKLSIFHKLHDFISPFVKRRWRGCSVVSTRVKRLFVKSPKKFGPKRKLSSVDEFLLVLMRIRLGLLNKDLASRFGISTCLCSQVFQTWLDPMSKVIGRLVFWPNKEQVVATKPDRYVHLPDLVSIIDCSEIFIETPKNLQLQFSTWSDYKHHNTLKYLISVAPNSAITFLSSLYSGRISDKALTNDCGYLDLLEPHDQIMADKGFPIYEECAARLVSVHIPPGKRGNIQMQPSHIVKTKRIANLRILVEQVIRRMKTFRLLKYEMPISIIYLSDPILRVVGGLCNLQHSMYDC